MLFCSGSFFNFIVVVAHIKITLIEWSTVRFMDTSISVWGHWLPQKWCCGVKSWSRQIIRSSDPLSFDGFKSSAEQIWGIVVWMSDALCMLCSLQSLSSTNTNNSRRIRELKVLPAVTQENKKIHTHINFSEEVTEYLLCPNALRRCLSWHLGHVSAGISPSSPDVLSQILNA